MDTTIDTTIDTTMDTSMDTTMDTTMDTSIDIIPMHIDSDIVDIDIDSDIVDIDIDSNIDNNNFNQGGYTLLENVNAYTKKAMDKLLLISCLTFSSIICFSVLFILFVALLYLF